MSRDRSRDRDIPPANTNSSDPKLLNARVFIGNLATDKVSRSDLVNSFGKYGRILGISLLRGYGFIQYESEEEGRAAVGAENGQVIKGQRIDVKMAAEGRRKTVGSRRSPPRDRGSPPRGRGGDDRGRAGRGRGFQDRNGSFRDRSPVRDTYGRGDQFGDDRRGGRDPYGRDGFSARDPYGRDPLARDPYADPLLAAAARDPLIAAARTPAAPLVVDCEIITLDTKIRAYADAIERRLRAVGVVCHQIALSSPDSLPKALEDIGRRGMLYAIVLNEQNEMHRSLTLNILHGTPQEHRNMPYDDALALVQKNFEEYRKKKAESVKSAQGGEFLKPDSSQAYLLNLLADNRFLTVEELNTVIKYLTARRDQIIAKEGGKSGGSSAGLKDEMAIAQEQQQLQAKILSILGGSSSASTASTATTPSLSATAQAQAAYYAAQQQGQPPGQPAADSGATATTNINFNNPSVQQALDNLMSTGGLKNIAGQANTSAAPEQYPTQAANSQVAGAPAPAPFGAPATPGVYQAYQQQYAGQPTAAPAGMAAGYAGTAATQQTAAGTGYTGYQYQGY